jgi:hypothetical protein
MSRSWLCGEEISSPVPAGSQIPAVQPIAAAKTTEVAQLYIRMCIYIYIFVWGGVGGGAWGGVRGRACARARERRSSVVVKALCYRPEGRGFDTR